MSLRARLLLLLSLALLLPAGLMGWRLMVPGPLIDGLHEIVAVAAVVDVHEDTVTTEAGGQRERSDNAATKQETSSARTGPQSRAA